MRRCTQRKRLRKFLTAGSSYRVQSAGYVASCIQIAAGDMSVDEQRERGRGFDVAVSELVDAPNEEGSSGRGFVALQSKLRGGQRNDRIVEIGQKRFGLLEPSLAGAKVGEPYKCLGLRAGTRILGLRTRLGQEETFELQSPSGTTYQLEVQVFWDGRREEDLRVMVSIDDGGWRVIRGPGFGVCMRGDYRRVN